MSCSGSCSNSRRCISGSSSRRRRSSGISSISSSSSNISNRSNTRRRSSIRRSGGGGGRSSSYNIRSGNLIPVQSVRNEACSPAWLHALLDCWTFSLFEKRPVCLPGTTKV